MGMGIYLTSEFDERRKDARINDKTMCKAEKVIFDGLPGDHLGKYTWKKRLPVPFVRVNGNLAAMSAVASIWPIPAVILPAVSLYMLFLKPYVPVSTIWF